MTEILDAEQLANRLQVDVRHIRRLTNDRAIPHLAIGPRMIRYDLDAVLAALRVTEHPDDHAIDEFAKAMRARMAEKRALGRNGWEECDPDDLGLRLLRAIADGDPIDIANYAMMLHALGAGADCMLERWLTQVLYERRSPMLVVKQGQIDAWIDVYEHARLAVAAWESEEGGIGEELGRLAEVLRK